MLVAQTASQGYPSQRAYPASQADTALNKAFDLSFLKIPNIMNDKYEIDKEA
jgi:hypothetical protein